MAIRNRVGQAAARAAELREALSGYQKALEVVRDFEERHPELAADLEPPSEDLSDEILGDNMQDTIYLAALQIGEGLEYEAEDVMEILRVRAPSATKVWRIDEKKARDALNRLSNDSGYKINKVREGTRGTGAVQPLFTNPTEDEVIAEAAKLLEEADNEGTNRLLESLDDGTRQR